MATKFVFNPFTGNFDVVSPAEWADLDCNLPDYIKGRPAVLAEDCSLKAADMVTTVVNGCRITTSSGDTLYSGTPYYPNDSIIEGRPTVLAIDGSLKTADMLTTVGGHCTITNSSGDTLYAGTPYFP